MIVKILSSASSEFNGVSYNDKKISKEKGELMSMKNFPSFINSESSQQEVRNYLKSISQNKKIHKPQFHAVISTKFQEHSKEQLRRVAEDFMDEMGYGKQPFIVVFHNDTENNHVHIVSTRVDKNTGKKINDSFEKLKSQRALSSVLEKQFGIKSESELKDLLEYKFSTLQQLEKILNRNGFKLVADEKKTNEITVIKNGISYKTLFLDKIQFSEEHQKDKRSKQIKAFLEKYKEMYSNKVFKVIDNREQKGMYERGENSEKKNISPKIEFESELQHKLREIFGIDIVFHFKDENKPFGYTLIDNATKKVYKGSNILKMHDLFEFTNDAIEKKELEQIKTYNLRSNEEKQILLSFFNQKGIEVKDFMLFEKKRFKKDIEQYKQFKEEVKELIKNPRPNDFVTFIKNENGDFYTIHQRYHQIHKLESLIGKEAYENFIHQKNKTEQSNDAPQNITTNTIDEILNELRKSSYITKDTTEEDFKRKRKKRR